MTAEHSRLVHFIYPSYYSSGVAVFAPGGEIEGVSLWEDLRGESLSVQEGHFVLGAASQTPALQNITLIPAASIEGVRVGGEWMCMIALLCATCLEVTGAVLHQ